VFARVGSGKNAKLSGLHIMDADGANVASLGAKDGRLPDVRR
jgi:hypothetical protein